MPISASEIDTADDTCPSCLSPITNNNRACTNRDCQLWGWLPNSVANWTERRKGRSDRSEQQGRTRRTPEPTSTGRSTSPERIESVDDRRGGDPVSGQTGEDGAALCQESLTSLLAEQPNTGTMPEIEARLRAMCRLGELVGAVQGRGELDYLHCRLAEVGAAHLGELRRAELEAMSLAIRSEISDSFFPARASR